jgi:hypothetical protein
MLATFQLASDTNIASIIITIITQGILAVLSASLLFLKHVVQSFVLALT